MAEQVEGCGDCQVEGAVPPGAADDADECCTAIQGFCWGSSGRSGEDRQARADCRGQKGLSEQRDHPTKL